MRSTEQVVVISGAASGIGLELGRLFAQRGASVGLIDRDTTGLEAFASELRKNGARCATAAADVRQREQVQDAVVRIVATTGPADILIPCAGICRASTVDDPRIAELEDIVRINFLGMVYLVEAALPAMLERGSGHIVGISSMAGLRGIPFEPGLLGEQGGGCGLSGKPPLGTQAEGRHRHDGLPGLCANPVAR